MKHFLKQYYVILLLAVLFSAPGIAAWYFFSHPNLLGQKSTNKGKLFNPPILMRALQKSTKWHLIYSLQGACDRDCEQELEKLAKIRLALGRKLYSVDLELVHFEGTPVLSQRLLTLLKEQGFQVRTVTASLQTMPSVLIANPDNYLVLGYETGVNPADIFHDLKHLLNNPGANT